MELHCNKQIMLQNIVFSIALMINILFYRYDKKTLSGFPSRRKNVPPVKVRRYDCTNVRMYECTKVRWYDGTNVRRYDGMNVRRYDGMNVRRYDSMMVRRYERTRREEWG